MLGSTYPDARDLPPRDGAGLLDDVAPILKRADTAFGNLEGPLLEGGTTKKQGPRAFAFRVPTRYGRYLKDAGFDVLSLANNHASDFGEEGRRSTRRALDALGIRYAGDKGSVARLDVRGRRIALLAFAHNPVSYHVSDLRTAARVTAQAKRDADLLLVSFHGGAEGSGHQHVPRGKERFLGEDRGDPRRFAHTVVDAGADLVLGHGPHVVRGMEVYGGRLIAYSLGNFATYGKFGLAGPTALSLILEVRLAEDGAFAGGRIHPVKQVRPGGPRRDPSGAVISVVARLSAADFGPRAVVVGRDGLLRAPAA